MRKAVLIFLIAAGIAGFIRPARAVEVAFLEYEDYHGRRVELEQGGRFAHIAISYRGGWLHAHPNTGVAWTRKLELYGRVSAILADPERPDPSDEFAQSMLGKPYDHRYDWDDDAIYCSELVAKALGLDPKPMRFESEAWRRARGIPRGEVGLSPDDIFEILSADPEWARTR